MDLSINSNPNSRVLNSGVEAHTFTKEEQIKGGQSKSEKKVFASRLNGMLNNQSLSDEQKNIIVLIRDKKFINAVCELIAYNISEIDDSKRRDIVITQLTKLIPNQVLTTQVERENTDDKITFKKIWTMNYTK